MKTQKYAVKRHKGTRSRAVVSMTLSESEVQMLDALGAARGMTRSAVVAQLARFAHAEMEENAQVAAADRRVRK